MNILFEKSHYSNLYNQPQGDTRYNLFKYKLGIKRQASTQYEYISEKLFWKNYLCKQFFVKLFVCWYPINVETTEPNKLTFLLALIELVTSLVHGFQKSSGKLFSKSLRAPPIKISAKYLCFIINNKSIYKLGLSVCLFVCLCVYILVYSADHVERCIMIYLQILCIQYNICRIHNNQSIYPPARHYYLALGILLNVLHDYFTPEGLSVLYKFDVK